MNSLTEAIKALPCGLTRREVGDSEKALLESLAAHEQVIAELLRVQAAAAPLVEAKQMMGAMAKRRRSQAAAYSRMAKEAE